MSVCLAMERILHVYFVYIDIHETRTAGQALASLHVHAYRRMALGQVLQVVSYSLSFIAYIPANLFMWLGGAYDRATRV